MSFPTQNKLKPTCYTLLLLTTDMNYQSSLFKSKSEWEKPTVADKVVEWAGVVGKHISWEFKNTIVGGERH